MATPSLAMIPSAYADSKLYSVIPNNGDGDFTFNRDSSATRIGQNGLIQTSSYYGSEQITNGDFSSSSDWTRQANASISGGVATLTAGATNVYIYQPTLWSSNALDGKNVLVTYTVTSNTLNSGQEFRLNGLGSVDFSGLNVIPQTIGTHSINVAIQGSSTNNRISIWITSGSITGSISIDNVSVKEVTGDQPRLNYDINANGQVQSCPSLLLEPASTNLIPYSEDFSQGSWNKAGLTVSSNQIISPDGSLNADEINITAANAHYLFDNISVNASTNYVLTFYAKKGTATDVSYSIYDNSNGADIIASTSYYTQISNTNWNRITVEFTTPSGCTSVRPYPLRDGSSTGTVYIWGAQLELSYATSYIPTLSGASQTRAAETCNDAGTASTFSDSEGVLYADFYAEANNTEKWITLSDGTSTNRVIVYIAAANALRIYVQNSSGAQADFASSITLGQYNKVAFSYKQNDFKLFLNGTKVGSDAIGGVPSGLDRLNLADTNGTTNPFIGNVKSVAVYNEALTDLQLQKLTTL